MDLMLSEATLRAICQAGETPAWQGARSV